MPQVASTLATDVKYTLWAPKSKDAPGGANTPLQHVTIHGGHGVAQKHAIHGGIETPIGVVTSVTDAQLELLKANSTFQTHMKNNYIRIIESDRKVASEKVADDLDKKEPSSPLITDDFQEGGRAAGPAELELSLGKSGRKGRR